LAVPVPDELHKVTVEPCTPGRGPRVVFSALDAAVAGDIEQAFAAAGHVVVSNARNYRMDPLVPLLIPEINADHLSIITEQRRARKWQGAIVTNPNCSTVVLAMALAPLRAFELRAVVVSTMQAVSGAGYPGVPSLDILGNVVPFISGEEEKMEAETLKILGTDGGRVPHPAVVSAHTNRVPVIDGHTMTFSIDLGAKPSVDDVIAALRAFEGRPQELDLPSAPKPVFHTKMVALGHNTVRGAAGAAILNAELMAAEGFFD
jgi:aspartate-semialdehyde dehydrogenase